MSAEELARDLFVSDSFAELLLAMMRDGVTLDELEELWAMPAKGHNDDS